MFNLTRGRNRKYVKWNECVRPDSDLRKMHHEGPFAVLEEKRGRTTVEGEEGEVFTLSAGYFVECEPDTVAT